MSFSIKEGKYTFHFRGVRAGVTDVFSQIIKNLRFFVPDPLNKYEMFATVKTKKSIGKIISEICDHYQISQTELFSKSRKTEIVKARHSLAYFLRTKKGMNYKIIGKVLGRHRTVAMDSCNVVKNCLHTGDFIARDILILDQTIN